VPKVIYFSCRPAIDDLTQNITGCAIHQKSVLAVLDDLFDAANQFCTDFPGPSVIDKAGSAAKRIKLDW
jgi:hypothetical protein